MTEKELIELKELSQELVRDEGTLEELGAEMEEQIEGDSPFNYFDATKYTELILKTGNMRERLIKTVPTLLKEIHRLRGVLEKIQYSATPEGTDPERIYKLAANALDETTKEVRAE